MGNIIIGNAKSKTAWVGTLITIFGVLYDNWSQVAQLIPPEYVGKVFSAFGVLMLILRNVTTTAISDKGGLPETPVSKQGGFVRTGIVAFLATLSLVIAACASMQANQGLYKLGIDVAVLKFVENSSPDKRETRIQRIKLVAAGVKGMTAGDSPVTIEALQTAVSDELKRLNLSPTDQLLAGELVNIIALELQARIGRDVLKPEQRVQVDMVMDWVIQAVELVEKR